MRATLRQTGAWWYLPIFAALASIGTMADTAYRSGYFPNDAIDVSGYAGVLAAMSQAGFAAFRSSGFLRHLNHLVPTRSPTSTIVTKWWPILIAPPVLYGLIIVISPRNLPRDATDWALLLTLMAVPAAAGCLGFGLAQILPNIVAVPLAVAITFVWTTFPAASDNLVLHQIDAGFTGCCVNELAPLPTAIGGSAALLLIVVVGGAATWRLRSAGLRAFGLVTVVAIAFMAASLIATSTSEQLDWMPLTQRKTEQICRSELGIEVCVWPENAHQLDRALDAAALVSATVVEAGFPPIEEVTESLDARSSVPFYADANRTDTTSTIARGYARHLFGCLTGEYERVDPISAMAAFELLVGVDPEAVAAEAEPDEYDAAVHAVRDGTIRDLLAPPDVWAASECDGER